MLAVIQNTLKYDVVIILYNASKKTVLCFIQNTLKYDVVLQRITMSYFRVLCVISHRNSCFSELANVAILSTKT